MQHRAKFRPNLYHRPTPAEAAAARQFSRQSSRSTTTNNTTDSDSVEDHDKERQAFPKRANFLRRFSRECKGKDKSPASVYYGLDEDDETDVLEVWFSGCHSGKSDDLELFGSCTFLSFLRLSTYFSITDVGGGSVLNSVPHSLANITLSWMVRQVIDSQCGILFDEAALARLSLPSPYPSQPNSSEPLDTIDALQPLHDELVLTKIWWLLEIIPWRYSWQDADGTWHHSSGYVHSDASWVARTHPSPLPDGIWAGDARSGTSIRNSIYQFRNGRKIPS